MRTEEMADLNLFLRIIQFVVENVSLTRHQIGSFDDEFTALAEPFIPADQQRQSGRPVEVFKHMMEPDFLNAFRITDQLGNVSKLVCDGVLLNRMLRGWEINVDVALQIAFAASQVQLHFGRGL